MSTKQDIDRELLKLLGLSDESAGLVMSRLHELERELAECRREAGIVMTALTKHFPPNPDWELCDSLMGIILQISNATTAWKDTENTLAECRAECERLRQDLNLECASHGMTIAKYKM